MKIFYDHQMFSIQKYGGITKYFCELMKNYPDGYKYNLSVLVSNNQHLKDNFWFFKKLYLPIPSPKNRLRHFLRDGLYNLNQFYSKSLISRNRFDILHPTYYDSYFLDYLKKPYVVTVHDLLEFKFKEYFPYSRIPQMERIIKNAKRIISISENTKKDLIEILKIDPERIDVIYHGFNRDSIAKNPNLHRRYILYVGARQGYKNFISLVKAFADLKINDPDLQLICAGSRFSKEEIDQLKKNGIYEDAIATGVNENELNKLYSNALAFVYPTLYEGFGMPILESFAHNCPVCLSNTSSLPEIAGNAGIYFDPTDFRSMSTAIKKVIYDHNFSSKMIDAGNERLNHFSWQKCAQRTMESYEKALS